MSPNTKQRIISGLLLVFLVLICLSLGREFTRGLILVIGIIVTDEIFCNFFKKKRFQISYFLTQLIFVAPYLYFNYINAQQSTFKFFIGGSILINLILLGYLLTDLFFNEKKKSSPLALPPAIFNKKCPHLGGLFILFPLMALSSLFMENEWKMLIGMLIILNGSTDVGAWFFGRRWGKHKLWPSVSPNKTLEGFGGGILTALLIGQVIWYSFSGSFSPYLLLLFSFFGVISQLGDLVQSKIKRSFKLKDSSSLIPGHGGFYDRIDGLIFLAPFAALALKYY